MKIQKYQQGKAFPEQWQVKLLTEEGQPYSKEEVAQMRQAQADAAAKHGDEKAQWTYVGKPALQALKNAARKLINGDARTAKTYGGTFEEAYRQARSNGEKTFYWNGRYYNTDYQGTHGKQYEEDIKSGKAAKWEQAYPAYTNPELRKEKQEEMDTYGITNEQTRNEDATKKRVRAVPYTYDNTEGRIKDIKNYVFNKKVTNIVRPGTNYLFGHPVLPGMLKISPYKRPEDSSVDGYYYGHFTEDVEGAKEAYDNKENIQKWRHFGLQDDEYESLNKELLNMYSNITDVDKLISAEQAILDKYNISEEARNNRNYTLEHTVTSSDKGDFGFGVSSNTPIKYKNSFICVKPGVTNPKYKQYYSDDMDDSERALINEETGKVYKNWSYPGTDNNENLGKYTNYKGDGFTSYYDLWDINPSIKSGNPIITIGKPFQFYDRIYYDKKDAPNIDKLYSEFKQGGKLKRK